MKSLLSTSSAFITAVTLSGALWLALGNDSRGFLPNLGAWLAVWALGLGNVLVLSLNLLRWRLYGAPLWLRGVVGVQILPAMICLGILGFATYGSWLESQADTQVVQIIAAIAADEPQRLTHAQAACSARCTASLPASEQLLRSVQAGSSRVAAQLIRQSVRVASDLGAPTSDARTCDGLYLPGLDALSLAVARNDQRMTILLWPVSDPGARRRALWTAAQTDRLAMVQWLSQAGEPLSIRGSVLDENNTLLVAAASGGAVHVGQWLIESQHMPVNALVGGSDPYTGTAPIRALYDFMGELGVTPEATVLLRQLVAGGADIDAASRPGDWPLEEAVRRGQKSVAKLLLDAGANPALLEPAQRIAMEKLLAQPVDAPHGSERPMDCINTH